MSGQDRCVDLGEILSQALDGVIDKGYLRSWIEFKEEWSEDDDRHWQSLLSRMKSDEDGALVLDPPIMSFEERSWANDFLRRAKARGLC